MKHKMMLNPSPFDMIKSGEKTIELRLNDDKRRKIGIGDEIEFVRTDDENMKLSAEVLAIHRFSSFDELYKTLSLSKCGYRPEELDKAKPEDMEAYYSKEKQNKYGVLGIEIKTI